jgi:hypothetical protein
LARSLVPTGLLVRPTILKVAPPPHAARISTRFPGGATFNIVGPKPAADWDARASNNIENGTSAAREAGLDSDSRN